MKKKWKKMSQSSILSGSPIGYLPEMEWVVALTRQKQEKIETDVKKMILFLEYVSWES
jgi:hypothetical protein